jgi:hypothetical protein
MRRLLGVLVVVAVVTGFGLAARAGDDKAALALVDKGIQALGGADNLKKANAATWKTKGKINFGGNENAFTSTATVQGLDHFRQELEGDFNGNAVKILVVVAGDKAWRGFNGANDALEDDALATQKRGVYLQVVPATLLSLKDKSFKIAALPDEKVGAKPAAGIKVTGPDGKDFKLYFDKDSGLPVKMVATVSGFMGGDFTQETTFDNYKDFGGIKKATKVVSTRDGSKFMESQITDFAVLDKVDPKLFAEPK